MRYDTMFSYACEVCGCETHPPLEYNSIEFMHKIEDLEQRREFIYICEDCREIAYEEYKKLRNTLRDKGNKGEI